MNVQDLFGPIAVILCPIFSFIVTLISNIDLNYTRTLDYFDEIENWIKKSKVEIISQFILFAQTDDKDGVFVERKDDTFLITQVERLDKVFLLSNMLDWCRKVFYLYNLGQLLMIIIGFLLLGFYIFFSDLYSLYGTVILTFSFGVIAYNLLSLLYLYRYKYKLREEYRRTYDPKKF